MANITYLLGAGASANSIPIVNEMRTRIIDVHSYLKETLNHCEKPINKAATPDVLHKNLKTLITLISKMEWLLGQAGDYYTLDTLAKKFYLEGDNESYEKLKECLILYFTIEQLFPITILAKKGSNFNNDPIDKRYGSFIASIAYRTTEGLRLNENIKMLSWNYDIQFELTMKKFLKNKNIFDITKEYRIHPKYNSNEINEQIKQNCFTIRKLNGNAILSSGKKENNDKTIFDLVIDEDDYFTALGKFLEEISEIDFPNNTSCRFFNFAWECNDDFEKSFRGRKHGGYANHLEEAERIAELTDILVVIGYSFPIFNREIDNRLFKRMDKNLKKVYIQDVDPDNIKSTMENAFEIFQKTNPNVTNGYVEPSEMKFHLTKNTNQFVIPYELNQ